MEHDHHRSRVPATTPYRLAVRAAVPLVPLLLRDALARRGHLGRLAAPRDLAAWAASSRDPSRPLVWIHAASVGEGLQARAVLAAIRDARPDLQLIATRFSASAERLAATMPADHVGYLPYDRPDDIRAALDALRPDVLVFAKLDVWPELATAAAARGVRVALVAGSVDPGSARLGWPARGMAEGGYAALDRIGAIDHGDAERLVRLGARRDRITVTGDPRIDSVLETVTASRNEPRLTLTDHPDTTLVAGSTWPSDETVLLEAFQVVFSNHPDARLVLVPHQPDSEAVSRLEAEARRVGVPTARWTGEASASPVVIVDRLGVLPRLYPAGRLAYVGGGFGRRGVHSVLEPAGWGRPVMIGPRDRGVRDARLLARAGGLVRLPGTDAVGALVAQWRQWLDDPALAERQGAAALAALEPDRGAARRNAGAGVVDGDARRGQRDGAA